MTILYQDPIGSVEARINARERWMRAIRNTLMVGRLARSTCLGGIPGSVGRAFGVSRAVAKSGHEDYLGKLRLGVKYTGAVDAIHMRVKAAQAAQAAMRNSGVITEAESEEHVASLHMWQQGDASLHSEEKLRKRLALRRSRRVVEQLQSFWDACRVYRWGDEGTCHALEHTVVDYEGYTAMARRLYKCILADYQYGDAEASILEDWESDTAPKASNDPNWSIPIKERTLDRQRFFDSLFELAECVSCVSIPHRSLAHPARWPELIHLPPIPCRLPAVPAFLLLCIACGRAASASGNMPTSSTSSSPISASQAARPSRRHSLRSSR